MVRASKNCAECQGSANPDLCELALKGRHFPSIGRIARCSGMSSWIALQGHHSFNLPAAIHNYIYPLLILINDPMFDKRNWHVE